MNKERKEPDREKEKSGFIRNTFLKTWRVPGGDDPNVAGSSCPTGLLTHSPLNPETQPIRFLAGAPLLWSVAWEGATGSGNKAVALLRDTG